MNPETVRSVEPKASRDALEPAQIAAVARAGHSLFSQGRLNEARRLFQGLALLEPENAYAHGVLGAIAQKEQNPGEAWIHYTIALRYAPNDIHLLTNRGELLLSRGLFLRAAEDFSRALSLDPEKKHPMSVRLRLLISLALEKLEHEKENGERRKTRNAES